jgi:endoglucanase
MLRGARFVAGCATVTTLLVGALPVAASAAPAGPGAEGGRSLLPGTRFFVPPPAPGSLQQIAALLAEGNVRGAGLIATMESEPTAVWLTGETAAQAAEGAAGSQQADQDVFRQVHQVLAQARAERAVPVFVLYNIPGRDCSQYSAGGAPSDQAYESWVSSVQEALRDAKAVVVLEPDALANLPGYCGSAYNAEFPQITDTTRIEDIYNAVVTLEQDPNVSVYLDAGHSAWQTVGNIAEVLVAAGVQQAQGFFLNVSNYQYATNEVFYGTWVSSCIAYALSQGATQQSALSLASSLSSADNNPSGPFANCPNQYWNGGPATNWQGTAMSPYGVWSEGNSQLDLNTAGIDSRFAQMLGGTVPSTHFIVDTSRDGLGPDDMESYANPPYDQPANVISALQSGNWCNPPGRGLGMTATADVASVPNSLDSYLPAGADLLDAYLWVKVPGQSDGQCDLAGGVRNWDDSAGTVESTIPGWPAEGTSTFETFDPLWSIETGSVTTDPSAGQWFPAQALELAQDANPALSPLSLRVPPGVGAPSVPPTLVPPIAGGLKRGPTR